MSKEVTRDALIAAFFQRFIEVFHIPPEIPRKGYYSLSSVIRMLGYESVRVAKKLVPESELADNGNAVSETGVVLLALKAKPTVVVTKVREICQLAISDLLFSEDESSPMRLYELCNEIRAVLDKFEPQKRANDFSL